MTNEIINHIKDANDQDGVLSVEVQIIDTPDADVKAVVFTTDDGAKELRLYAADADELYYLLTTAKSGAEFVDHLAGFLEDASTVFPPKKEQA